MADELDDWTPVINHAPASTEVYRRVRLRMRNLRALRKFGQEHDNPQNEILIEPKGIRQLAEARFGSRFTVLDDRRVEEKVASARKWLFGMLDCHDKSLDREHQMRLFRVAEEKQIAGWKERWTEMETLYMALTDYELATPQERLRTAFMVVLHLNLASGLQDVSILAAVRTENLQRAATMDAAMDSIRDQLVERGQLTKVDNFACAIPLSLLATTANNTSVVDENAGCCPICQNSYTALSAETTFGESLQVTSEAFPIEDLLADFPVRIKHCGHIVGKACLEQWMVTPKIDEAKYPHRTCPLCRIKIEGVKTPEVPEDLIKHLTCERRALETVRDLLYGYDVGLRECVDIIFSCMSDEIACKELLAEIGRAGQTYEREEKILNDKLAELKKEKWALGFRGDGVWRMLRDEWMNSGVVRRE